GSIAIKVFSQPLNVLSNVIFSYISNISKIKQGNRKSLLLVAPLFAIITYIFGMIIGPIIIQYIYPDYFLDAMDIFWILNLALSLTILDFIYRGYLIKFYPLIVKTLLDSVSLLIFIITSVWLTMMMNNLFGIAYAQLISYVFKNSIQYVLIFTLKTN